MKKRKIIQIDRGACNGCGICTTACAEGALALDDENKAVLLKEIYCDGLGACLDVCPTGALKIIEKESSAYDPGQTVEHVKKLRGEGAAGEVHGASDVSGCTGGCPGSRISRFTRKKEGDQQKPPETDTPSALEQWPVQLHLVSPQAPYFKGCDILVAADCTAFSYGNFHEKLLKGKKLVIACPKLDRTETYIEKLTQLFKSNDINSVTVAIMSVPCCSGLRHITETALRQSGKNIPYTAAVIGIDGELTH